MGSGRAVAPLLALAAVAALAVPAAPAGAAWSSASGGHATARADGQAPPGALSASCNVLLSASVQLDWVASASPWTSYEVRWGTTSGGPYPNSSGVVAGLSYATPALGAGTWWFVVRSAAGSWRSASSNEVSKTVVSVLGVGLVCL